MTPFRCFGTMRELKEIEMPWIENRAKSDIAKGLNRDPGSNGMLIQIVDPACVPPTPVHQFRQVHVFEFLDLEDADESMEEDWKISDAQAAELVRLLQHALAEDMNVVVHCTMGVCRSGAVVDVACALGFDDPTTYRAPNLRVKNKMMKVLGWTYEDR